MAFIPWPNSIKVVLEFTISGIPVTVTIALTKPSALEAGDLQTGTDAVKNWCVDELMDHLSEDVQFSRITGYDMTSSTGEVYATSSGLPVNGAVDAAPIDIGSAADISFRTPNRGRSGRGRNYVPGVPLTDRLNTAQFTTTLTNNLAGDYGALPSFIPGGLFAHTVASEQLDGVVRNPAVMQNVETIIGNNAIANQRKRGLNSG